METLAPRLVNALLNGAYQGLGLTAFVGLTLLLLRRSNAATRHAAHLATLGVVALLPLLHFLFPLPAATVLNRKHDVPLPPVPPGFIPPQRIDAPRSAELTPSFPSSPSSAPSSGLRIDSSGTIPADAPAPRRIIPEVALQPTRVAPANSIPLRQDPPAEPVQLSPLPSDQAVLDLAPDPTTDWVKSSTFVSATAPAPKVAADRTSLVPQARVWPVSQWHWRPTVPAVVGPALVVAWLLVAGARLAFLFRQGFRLRALKRQGSVPPASALSLFEDLRRDLRVTRPVRLVTIPEHWAPLVAGFRRPAILLPDSLAQGATEVQLEHVLRHELAHVQRRDDWTNLFQQVVKALLFFHPAVWWLSRRLTVDREIACDDCVLAATRTPRAYALLLTDFAGRNRGQDWAAAPAGWNTHSQLKERIAMILDSNRNASTAIAKGRLSTLTTAAVAAACIGLVAGPRIALAQSKASTGSALTEVSAAKSGAAAPAAVASIGVSTGAKAQAGAVVLASPKPKPALAPAPASAAVLAAAPKPPLPPAEELPPSPQVFVVPEISVPPMAPLPPAVVRMPNLPLLAANRNVQASESLERRLERVERLLESLVQGEGGPRLKVKGPDGPIAVQIAPHPVPEIHVNVDTESHDEACVEATVKEHTEKAMERAKHEQERQVQHAMRQAQQAQNMALKQRRQQFQEHRQALERELKEVERQVERLEREREKLEAQQGKLEEQLDSISNEEESEEESAAESEADNESAPAKK